ncbi:UNVERIFIED_CONTAM: hypothetical protein H355_007860 [Colinus virginianus]|nr:hypothetical protein H355_007860 [Colinus virginianus]
MPVKQQTLLPHTLRVGVTTEGSVQDPYVRGNGDVLEGQGCSDVPHETLVEERALMYFFVHVMCGSDCEVLLMQEQLSKNRIIVELPSDASSMRRSES